MVIGSELFRGEEEREMGFRAWLRGRAAHLRVLDISGGYGVYDRTFERVSQALKQHPELKAVYSVGGGNRAIVDAFAALDRPLEVFIGHDLDEENRQLLARKKSPRSSTTTCRSMRAMCSCISCNTIGYGRPGRLRRHRCRSSRRSTCRTDPSFFAGRPDPLYTFNNPSHAVPLRHHAGNPSINRASAGVAARAPCLAHRSTAISTSSALLRASRSWLIRILSSSPVRTASPLRFGAPSITLCRYRPMPAAVHVALGRTRLSSLSNIQRVFFHRHGIFYSHHELHMRMIGQQAALDQAFSPIDMRQIENFDLWHNLIRFHAVLANSTTNAGAFS